MGWKDIPLGSSQSQLDSHVRDVGGGGRGDLQVGKCSVLWTEPGNLVSLAVLAVINVLVIVGNCLVIAAVFCSHKLRSVTNFFIVSLAVADLLVGLAVLPFSATWEVFK
uniref:G-protein coupled receptors family 1 profile domain-containing protein n=1 Tax=Lutzomyia longipalpis TaxID=7200 RepID=A0A1B0CRD3_LUTLO